MRTILLADDSPTIRRLVTQTFADANFKISEVSNGDAAIKRFEELKPDIVLTDIYMPGKNGYEVCAYVRNHPLLGATPVVLLVGAFDAFDEERAKHSGAAANITKPFEPRALIDLVNSILTAEAAPAEEPAAATKSETASEAVPQPEAAAQATPDPAVQQQPVVEQIPMPQAVAQQQPAPARAAAAEAHAGPPPAATADEDDILGLHV